MRVPRQDRDTLLETEAEAEAPGSEAEAEAVKIALRGCLEAPQHW